MLQAASPSSYVLRAHRNKAKNRNNMGDDNGSDDDFEESSKAASRGKSRRELPAGAVATLKAWLLSPEHFTHPYPTPQDQVMLMQKTGIDKKQLKNWFTNARRRIWKPMLKKQLEQGKLTATGAGGGGVAVAGVVPGLMIPGMQMPGQHQDNDQLRMHYGMQQSDQHHNTDSYGNQMYAPVAASAPNYFDPSQQNMAGSTGSIGSLPAMSAAGQAALSKADSHAVLMELFARDQDLVRQATEKSTKGAPATGGNADASAHQQEPGAPSMQHPMKSSALQSRLAAVPTLNSWPHFSSISSLNNLGTMPGVKSITSMSGADLEKQGPVNRVGNLAQVKSMESMGKNDSYAFLEVFFGDKGTSSLNLNSSGSKEQRGIKREREDDGDVGLSLEDEGPSSSGKEQSNRNSSASGGNDDTSTPFMTAIENDTTGVLKRAYDDALAARGLIAVSRSSEKLTDLALPPKIQRTLSQEFMRQAQPGDSFYSYTAPVAMGSGSQQYPGQHPDQSVNQEAARNDGSARANKSVEVPAATKCAQCNQISVDTQLRPCGHMFHERCLKPSLHSAAGAPKCPIDHIPIQSALLAIPSDNISAHYAPSSWAASDDRKVPSS